MRQNKFPQNQKQKTPDALLQHQPDFRQCILVVEDDADIRRLNTEVLMHSGYHVDAAEDGAAAWDALQLNKYDLMITDQHMPKVSGVELLHKIHDARMALPVVMATGILPTWEFASHPWIIPAKMLLKPYTSEKLLATVKSVLCATASVRVDVVPPPDSGKVGLQ
jgi:two-component system alkaline phosphatase synthesis response regulator PhoP